jgi:PAS domain S-box-containing protein
VRLEVLATQENQEDRAQLAVIVESSDDAIIGKTLEGIITSWNDGARRVFGYTAEEMVGQPVSRLIPADRLDEEPDILARLQRGERVKHFETVRQHKDGSLVEVSLSSSPIRDGSGRIVGASKIARDVSGR